MNPSLAGTEPELALAEDRAVMAVAAPPGQAPAGVSLRAKNPPSSILRPQLLDLGRQKLSAFDRTQKSAFVCYTTQADSGVDMPGARA